MACLRGPWFLSSARVLLGSLWIVYGDLGSRQVEEFFLNPNDVVGGLGELRSLTWRTLEALGSTLDDFLGGLGGAGGVSVESLGRALLVFGNLRVIFGDLVA